MSLMGSKQSSGILCQVANTRGRSAAREPRPVTTIVREKGRSAADMAGLGTIESLILRP